jgi:uncharacterized protein
VIFRRSMALLVLLLPQLAAAQSEAPRNEALYKAETIVTGTGEAERMRGFRIGAEDVLVKLTGKARLVDTKRAQSVADQAADLVAEHSYEDRMKDIPIHDEQGTRDRPHYLRMRFDAEKFDKALRDAGLKAWTGARPTLAVWVGIREPRGKFVLSQDGGEGYGQREVLKEASKKRGIPILLPTKDQQAVTYVDIEKSNWPALRKASKELGATAVLYGLLEFDGNTHWNTRWVVSGDHAYAKWKLSGVTFDRALKSAIDQVAAAHARQAN